MDEPTINLNLNNEIISGTEVSTNVKQQIIVVSKDRAKLVLKEYEAQQKGKIDWKTPIALLFTILIALLTADFKDSVFGFEKGFWQAFFTIALIISAIWCISNIVKAAKQKCKSVDAVVEELCDNKQAKTIYQDIESLPRISKWIVKWLIKKQNND